MKILAASLVSSRSGGVYVCLLKQKKTFGPYATLNDLRLELGHFDFIPPCDMDDFGRGSIAVRYSMLGALFAQGDAGRAIPPDTAVVGWNGRGCTAENLRYWHDYTTNGRAGGRGSLFVATLPTIPYCEAAITLGLHGPAAYFQTEPSVRVLSGLLAARPEGLYLVGEIGDASACFLLLDNTADEVIPEANSLETLFCLLAGAGK